MTGLLRKAEVWVGSACLFVMFALICANIVMRYFFNAAIFWAEEVSNYAFVWAAFLSCAYVLSQNEHLRVTVLTDRLSPRAAKAVELVNLAVIFGIFVSLVWPSIALLEQLKLTPALRIPEAVPYTILPVAFTLCALHALAMFLRLFSELRDAGKASAS